MEITIFAKKAQSLDGRNFTRFITKLLNNSTGELETMSVNFREECGQPKGENCPMNIIVNKGDCNISSRTYVDKNGDEQVGKTLWISAWESGSEYIDHSTDSYF